jgi:hypothetical protein
MGGVGEMDVLLNFNQNLTIFSTLISVEGLSFNLDIFEANLINITLVGGGLFYLLRNPLYEGLIMRQLGVYLTIQPFRVALRRAAQLVLIHSAAGEIYRRFDVFRKTTPNNKGGDFIDHNFKLSGLFDRRFDVFGKTTPNNKGGDFIDHNFKLSGLFDRRFDVFGKTTPNNKGGDFIDHNFKLSGLFGLSNRFVRRQPLIREVGTYSINPSEYIDYTLRRLKNELETSKILRIRAESALRKAVIRSIVRLSIRDLKRTLRRHIRDEIVVVKPPYNDLHWCWYAPSVLDNDFIPPAGSYHLHLLPRHNSLIYRKIVDLGRSRSRIFSAGYPRVSRGDQVRPNENISRGQ